ncbi:MAG: DUF1801 domain-containing protein [Isosphaeraceae bacterium]
MPSTPSQPDTIDAYIAAASPEAQPVLEKIRALVKELAPGAEETISYRMPAFRQGGIIVYFAAFKKHIGMYPPVKGDAKLIADLGPYLGEKGNLQFPLDAKIPYPLIKRVVKARLQELAAKAGGKAPKRSAS